MGWTDKGNGNRTLATTIPKAGVNNYIYGDDAHTDAATSELAFAGIENGTNFQNTFEFEAPEWITGISAVENSNSIDNLKYYNLKFNVASNSEGNPARTGDIIIKYHEQTLKLTVNQEAAGSTAYTLYIYDPSKLSTHFSYYRVNSGPNAGNEPVAIPDNTYTILLYTYSASTENNKITVELQPKSTNISSKFGFTTSTSSPVENLVKYTGTTVDELYANHGFSSVSYSSAQGYGYATTNSNTNMWGENISTDASTFINLDHMAPYPPIDIYISNMLLRTKIINVFSLYMVNTGEEQGGGVKLGEFTTFNGQPFPSLYNDEIEILHNITQNGVPITILVNITTDNNDMGQINNAIYSQDIIGVWKFIAKPANANNVDLDVTQDDNLFTLGCETTNMYINLFSTSGAGNPGGIVIDYDTSGSGGTNIVNLTPSGTAQTIDLKLPVGYRFNLNNGQYTEDHIRLDLTYNFNITKPGY